METIKAPTRTKAKKDHRCMFCNAIIPKGSIYIYSVHKYDTVYSWKTHITCAEIASKLKMYDSCDEGVDADYFIETIRNEYQTLMSKFHNELYESKVFVYPKFSEQLEFVLMHYKITSRQV